MDIQLHALISGESSTYSARATPYSLAGVSGCSLSRVSHNHALINIFLRLQSFSLQGWMTASTATSTSSDWWQRRDIVLIWHMFSQYPKMLSTRPLDKVWAWKKGSTASPLQPSQDVEIIMWPTSLKQSLSPAWQASLSEACIQDHSQFKHWYWTQIPTH